MKVSGHNGRDNRFLSSAMRSTLVRTRRRLSLLKVPDTDLETPRKDKVGPCVTKSQDEAKDERLEGFSCIPVL